MVASQPFSHGTQQSSLSVHAWLRWMKARGFGSEEDAGIETSSDLQQLHVEGRTSGNAVSTPDACGRWFCFFLRTVIVSVCLHSSRTLSQCDALLQETEVWRGRNSEVAWKCGENTRP